MRDCEDFDILADWPIKIENSELRPIFYKCTNMPMLKDHESDLHRTHRLTSFKNSEIWNFKLNCNHQAQQENMNQNHTILLLIQKHTHPHNHIPNNHLHTRNWASTSKKRAWNHKLQTGSSRPEATETKTINTINPNNILVMCFHHAHDPKKNWNSLHK